LADPATGAGPAQALGDGGAPRRRPARVSVALFRCGDGAASPGRGRIWVAKPSRSSALAQRFRRRRETLRLPRSGWYPAPE